MRALRALVVGGVLLIAAQAVAVAVAPRREAAGIGGLPPGEFAGTLMLGGFRGLACDLLWLRAVAAKEGGRTYESVALAEAITRVQPRFVDVWQFLAHDLAYNIGFDADGEDARYAWFVAGMNANARGVERNPGVERLLRHLAWMMSHKGGLFQSRVEAQDWAPLLNPLLAEVRARTGGDARAADLPGGGGLSNSTIAFRLYAACVAIGDDDLRAQRRRQPAFVRRMVVHALDADANRLRNRGDHLAAIHRWLDALDAWAEVAVWADTPVADELDQRGRASTRDVYERNEGRIRRKTAEMALLLAPDQARGEAAAAAIRERRWAEARRLLAIPGWKASAGAETRIRWLDE